MLRPPTFTRWEFLVIALAEVIAGLTGIIMAPFARLGFDHYPVVRWANQRFDERNGLQVAVQWYSQPPEVDTPEGGE